MPNSPRDLNETRISRTAAHFLGSVTREEWLVLQHVIDEIARDPAVDDLKKFSFPQLPIVRYLYYESPFVIIYRPAPPYLFIDSIRRIGYIPPPEKWEEWIR